MNRIKSLRAAQVPKMSQDKLARLVGVGRTTVTMWETGSNEPDNATVVKLAEIFGVSTDYILGRDVKENAPGLTKKDEAPHPQNGVVVYKDGRAVARKFPRLAVEDIDRLLELMHKQMGAVDDEDQP